MGALTSSLVNIQTFYSLIQCLKWKSENMLGRKSDKGKVVI